MTCPTPVGVTTRHWPMWVAAMAGLLLGALPSVRAGAQSAKRSSGHDYDDRTVPEEFAPQSRLDTLRQLHLIHVSPHVIVFDSTTHTATIELKNISNLPIRGNVAVLFAYPTWPHSHPADTTVFTQDMESIEARDTTVLSPTPKDHFVGPWLSGLPAQVVLAPHKTQRVTLKITPPPTLPIGEYWARFVVSVNPQDQHRGRGQDVSQHYALPIKGVLPVLRDSALIFYRQGALHMGLTFGSQVAAQMDATGSGIGGPDGRDCPHSLWVRLPMHLTGTTHVDGTLLVSYRNVQTGAVTKVNKFLVSLYRDEVTHWWTHTCWVTPGTYRATLLFKAEQLDFPANQRLPMAPVEYTIPTPFTITR